MREDRDVAPVRRSFTFASCLRPILCSCMASAPREPQAPAPLVLRRTPLICRNQTCQLAPSLPLTPTLYSHRATTDRPPSHFEKRWIAGEDSSQLPNQLLYIPSLHQTLLPPQLLLPDQE